jgi:hypothetical protein
LFRGTFDGNALAAAWNGMADILVAVPAPVESTRRVLPSPRVAVGPPAGEHEVPITSVQRLVREHLS